MQLKGSRTEANLKAAFAGESQANRRYLYFAAKADVEGYNDVAALFRSTAEGETINGSHNRLGSPLNLRKDLMAPFGQIHVLGIGKTGNIKTG